MALGCYVSSTLNLTCALSFAGGNGPSLHPEASQIHQNIKIHADGRGSADTATTTHVQGLLSDDWAGLILHKSIFFLRKMLLTIPFGSHHDCREANRYEKMTIAVTFHNCNLTFVILFIAHLVGSLFSICNYLCHFSCKPLSATL